MQAWRSLSEVLGHHDLPLLFKFVPNASTGYELFVTDLTSLWAERLDHKQVLRRSYEEAASIDPTESSDQFEVLLIKLEEAFDHEKGTVSLHYDEDRQSLTLKTETPLPAPFDPLTWTFFLKKQPQSAFTEHVTLPLVSAERLLEQRFASLISLIKDKDWALGKLLDKLDASGVDMSTLFPGQTRKSLANIRGLASFKEQDWERQTMSEEPSGALGGSILQALPSKKKLEELLPAPEQWWQQIESRQKADSAPSTKKDQKAGQKGKVADARKERDSFEDDFESIPSGTSPKKAVAEAADTPESESEEPSPQKKSKHTRQHVVEETDSEETQFDKRKENAKGIRSKDKRSHESDSESSRSSEQARPRKKVSQKPRRKATSDSEATASEDEPPRRKRVTRPKKAASDSESSDDQRKKASGKKAGLGKVGGGRGVAKSAKESQLETDEDSSSEGRPSKSLAKRKKGGLGKIGMKKHERPKSDSGAEKGSSEESSPAAKKTTTQRKGKLGKIGGKKADAKLEKKPSDEEEKETEEEETASEEDTERPKRKAKPKGKLGMVGARHKQAKSASPKDGESTASDRGSPRASPHKPAPSPPAAEEEKEETPAPSQEQPRRPPPVRVAAPQKKKRRF